MESIDAGQDTGPFPGGGVNSGQAREVARLLLERLEVPPERAADVLTVVSELTANARQHAGGVTGFRITAQPGAVLVEVSDASARLPVEREWSPAEPGGFGWRLVNQLAVTTGIRCHRGGKTITATITITPPVP
ncbi:ATP-binding protein [Streptomyces sp. NPDC048387]|uniref:ATP-binding protein n=1 Tax=unclassified Streptomyces TaxID=2593676 RepID=UPI0033F42572